LRSLKCLERLYIEQKDGKFVQHFIIAEGARMVSKCHLYQWTIWMCVFVLCSMLSCSKSSENGPQGGGQLLIKLLDAPAHYEHVNVSILLVSIHRTGADVNLGWSIVSTQSVEIDLLSLRNGNSETLVLNTVDAGKYNQIKLRFGACTVVENGMESLLNFNTAPLFEHVINYNFEVQEGVKAQLSIDFNVALSVYKNGISNYSFTPVIRVQNTLLCGSISGSVVDTSHTVVPASIFTWTGTDSVSTLNDMTNGSFQLSDLPETYYSVSIVPFDTFSFHEKRIDSLVVTRQTTHNLGAIILQRR
jgi:hypothetical protein